MTSVCCDVQAYTGNMGACMCPTRSSSAAPCHWQQQLHLLPSPTVAPVAHAAHAARAATQSAKAPLGRISYSSAGCNLQFHPVPTSPAAQSRLLDDMRPTDYLAIIELMNTTRFSPSRATLVDLFTAASLSLGTGYERGAASTRAIFAPSPSSSPAHAHPAAPAAHNGSLSSPGAVAAAQLFTDAAPTASNNVLVYASGAAASLVSTAVGAAANGRSTSPQRTTSPSRTAPPAMNGASVSISSVTASSNPSPASSPQRPARGAAAAASAGRWVMSAALSGTGALPAAAPRPLLRPAEALRLLNGLTDLRELFSCHGIHEQIPEMCAFRSKVVDVLHKMSMEPQQHDE